MTRKKEGHTKGIGAALASALFLGLAPILGKQAIALGFTPLAVVALRTTLAAALMLLLAALFRRAYLYIYPAGLLGCALAGATNGLGSLLYFLALERLSASVGQLLYSLYPLFLALWLLLDRQPPGRLTYLRMGLAIGGVFFLTHNHAGRVDWIGVLLMLGAAAMYALHLPINQRVLYDIPAPTVTLYTLLAMSAIVLPAYLLFDRRLPAGTLAWHPLLGLTLTTFLARLTIFMGVKHLGGMQTALLGLSELFVTIILSYYWLHEVLWPTQWIGAALLAASLLLIGLEKFTPPKRRAAGGWLGWVRPPEVSQNVTWGPHD
jgi:drug/metabolite transporter (DMT)-like permease